MPSFIFTFHAMAVSGAYIVDDQYKDCTPVNPSEFRATGRYGCHNKSSLNVLTKSIHCIILLLPCISYGTNQKITNSGLSGTFLLKKWLLRSRIIDIIDNPNSEKYENQKIYIISYNDYIYVMPVIQEKQHIKLLTIFKSRKFNKIYGRTGGKNETR